MTFKRLLGLRILNYHLPIYLFHVQPFSSITWGRKYSCCRLVRCRFSDSRLPMSWTTPANLIPSTWLLLWKTSTSQSGLTGSHLHDNVTVALKGFALMYQIHHTSWLSGSYQVSAGRHWSSLPGSNPALPKRGQHSTVRHNCSPGGCRHPQPTEQGLCDTGWHFSMLGGFIVP